MTVLVEHGGHGGSTAGPIVADIYKWLYKKGYFAKAEVPVDGVDSNSSK